MTPCDLHVLNTPPAFVLSQNQTLRKKFGWRLPLAEKRISKLTLGGPLAGSRRFRAPQIGAQRTIQSFISLPALIGLFRAGTGVSASSGTPRAGPHCQRTPFEGTKKPISRETPGFSPREPPPRSTVSVSRPPSLVAAREASPPRPPTSTHFLTFFQFFSKSPDERVGFFVFHA